MILVASLVWESILPAIKRRAAKRKSLEHLLCAKLVLQFTFMWYQFAVWLSNEHHSCPTHPLHLAEFLIDLLVQLVNLGLLPLNEGIVPHDLFTGMGDDLILLLQCLPLLLQGLLQLLQPGCHIGDSVWEISLSTSATVMSWRKGTCTVTDMSGMHIWMCRCCTFLHVCVYFEMMYSVCVCMYWLHWHCTKTA